MKTISCPKRIIKMDIIRLFKLLEIVYYTIISFIITFFVANFLENDKYMPYIFKTYDYEKASLWDISIDIIIDLSILSIFIYYLRKSIYCIPFIFGGLNRNYKSNMKSELSTGVSLGLGITLYKSLPTVSDKISELNRKIKAL